MPKILIADTSRKHPCNPTPSLTISTKCFVCNPYD